MNEYELTYIRRIGLEADKIKKLDARISKAFEKHGGQVLRLQDFGEKSMAYQIRKEARGHYIQINFAGNGELIDELEGHFKISPEILRFLTVRLSRNVDPEQKKQEYAQPKPAVEASEST